jgi:hypothetical protein
MRLRAGFFAVNLEIVREGRSDGDEYDGADDSSVFDVNQ